MADYARSADNHVFDALTTSLFVVQVAQEAATQQVLDLVPDTDTMLLTVQASRQAAAAARNATACTSSFVAVLAWRATMYVHVGVLLSTEQV